MSGLLDDLKKSRKKSNTSDLIVKQIIDNCVSTIKNINLHGRTRYNFVVPRILDGFPLYDVKDIAILVNKKLKKLGFKTVYVSPDEIVISWN